MVKFSIRSKFTLSILTLILLLTLSITLISVNRMERIVIDRSAGYLLRDLKDGAETIMARIRSVDDLTKTIIAEASVQSRLDGSLVASSQEERLVQMNLESRISSLRLSRPEIDSVYIYDARGVIVLGEISYPVNKSVDVASYVPSAAAIMNGLASLDTAVPNTYVPFLKPIKSLTDFRVIGYLQINIKENAIREVLSAKMPDPAGSFVVRNAFGSPISYTGRMDEINATSAADSEAPPLNGFILKKVNGEKSVLASYTDSLNRWSYAVVVPVKQITGELDSIVYLNLLTGVLFGIVAIVCSIAIGWGISRPIMIIARSIRRVESGDFNIQVKYEGKDEIGLLARAFNRMVHEIDRLINEVYRLELLEKEQEIRTLQAQINPHFLYNAFDSINYMARAHNAEPVSRMIVALGNLMRSSIMKKQDAVVTLRDEITLVENYLTLQKIRFGDRLVVHYDINDDLLDVPIPKLVVQPLVENAIVHGIGENATRGIVEINIAAGDGAVEIQVIDNGKGMTERQLRSVLQEGRAYEGKGTGMGLYGVHKRIRLIYGDQYGLFLTSELGKYTNVTLKIPGGEGRSHDV